MYPMFTVNSLLSISSNILDFQLDQISLVITKMLNVHFIDIGVLC